MIPMMETPFWAIICPIGLLFLFITIVIIIFKTFYKREKEHDKKMKKEKEKYEEIYGKVGEDNNANLGKRKRRILVVKERVEK